MRLLLASLLLSFSAHASSGGWQLSLLVYSSAEGHTLSPESYIAEFRLPAQSEDDCERIGKLGLLYFKSGQLPDNSVSLAGFSCDPL